MIRLHKQKLTAQQRRILRLRRGIHRRRYFKEVRGHGSPHHAEIMIRLEGKTLNPPTDAKVINTLRARLEFRRQLRVERRNKAFAERWMAKVEEAEENTEMAGLFALERALTFLAFFTAPRTKLKYQDIHLLMLCGGRDGLPMKVASDITGLRYMTLWASMKKMVTLGYMEKAVPVILEGGCQTPGDEKNKHLEICFPLTPKGKRLWADLAKFDTREFSRMFDLMQRLDPINNTHIPKERLRSAVRCGLDEMHSRLSLDW